MDAEEYQNLNGGESVFSGGQALSHRGSEHSGDQGRDKVNSLIRSSHYISAVVNPTRIHEDVSPIPGLAQRAKDLALLRAVA